jgi:hypothetical protein
MLSLLSLSAKNSNIKKEAVDSNSLFLFPRFL